MKVLKEIKDSQLDLLSLSLLKKYEKTGNLHLPGKRLTAKPKRESKKKIGKKMKILTLLDFLHGKKPSINDWRGLQPSLVQSSNRNSLSQRPTINTIRFSKGFGGGSFNVSRRNPKTGENELNSERNYFLFPLRSHHQVTMGKVKECFENRETSKGRGPIKVLKPTLKKKVSQKLKIKPPKKGEKKTGREEFDYFTPCKCFTLPKNRVLVDDVYHFKKRNTQDKASSEK